MPLRLPLSLPQPRPCLSCHCHYPNPCPLPFCPAPTPTPAPWLPYPALPCPLTPLQPLPCLPNVLRYPFSLDICLKLMHSQIEIVLVCLVFFCFNCSLLAFCFNLGMETLEDFCCSYLVARASHWTEHKTIKFEESASQEVILKCSDFCSGKRNN